MNDLRKLKAGKLLMKNGFEPIRFRALGKIVAIGLARKYELPGDLVRHELCVEPINRRSGVEYLTTFNGKFQHVYHVKGKEIIKTVNKILKDEELEGLNDED